MGDRGRGPHRWRTAAAALGAAVLLWAAVGCGGEAVEARERAAPTQLAIFVYDRSGSMPTYQLELAHELTARRVLELDHGDLIVGMELLEASLAEPPRRWSQQVPAREYADQRVASDSVARIRFLRDARDYMRTFTDTAARQPSRGTDVLSTLHDVAADLRAHRGHRATLYLFSDMLQSNEQLDFERPGTRPRIDWVDSAAARGTLPDLGGLCVVVVGARVDTEAGQEVKAFWRRYFEATGAELRDHNYALRPVRLSEAPCGDV